MQVRPKSSDPQILHELERAQELARKYEAGEIDIPPYIHAALLRTIIDLLNHPNITAYDTQTIR